MIYLQLFLSFLQIGMFSFGGGSQGDVEAQACGSGELYPKGHRV